MFLNTFRHPETYGIVPHADLECPPLVCCCCCWPFFLLASRRPSLANHSFYRIFDTIFFFVYLFILTDNSLSIGWSSRSLAICHMTNQVGHLPESLAGARRKVAVAK